MYNPIFVCVFKEVLGMLKRALFLSVFSVFFAILSLQSVFSLPDLYEPDNNYSDAFFISVSGIPQTHNFTSVNDSDYVKFNATAGLVYYIRTANLSDINSADTVITLYSTDGTTQLVEHDDVEDGVVRYSQVAWKASVSGTYFVKIREFSGSVGGVYNISVQEHGYLFPYAISPFSAVNVSKFMLFNFSAGVRCVGGPCLNIRATLDPIEGDSALLQGDDAKPAKVVSGKVDKRLFALLENDLKVPVIIKLRDDDMVDGERAFVESKRKRLLKGAGSKLDSSSFVSREELRNVRKGIIHSKQDEVLDSLESEDGSDFDLKFQYSSVNQLAGDVTEEGLQKLIDDPDVEYVYFDTVVHASLAESVPLINADDVRALVVDSNITGSGQTVCVIDTGISYDHADFGSCSLTSNINDGSCPKVIGGYDFVNSDSDPVDDNGHGSHAAGIVASIDSTYRGVAPGAALVALKALGASGSGDSSDVIAGIDWCVSNSSRLNITVISMSLGDDSRQSAPCVENSMAPAVKAALGQDIFVAAASGNDHYGESGMATSGLSAPACIPNVTSVGSTTKADAMASYTNRGLILDLLAPGDSITATNYGGAHTVKSGTSMATPHVAGAAALVRQYYLEKFDRDITPMNIEHALKFNGIAIPDSGTGLTFTRIDALDAVTSKGDVSTVVGATPFYTISANPSDASCLQSLAVNSSCNITWVVNATGDMTNYEFFVIFETEYAYNTSPRINVSIGNSAPVLNASIPNITWAEDVINSSLVLTLYFIDADNHPLLFSATAVSNVAVSINSTSGVVNFIPEGNFSGVRYVNFTASDGFNTTQSNTVTLNITPVDDAPSFNVSSSVAVISWPQDMFNASLNISSYFWDLEGDDLNFTASGVESISVVINNDSGLVNFTPSTGFVGVRSVVFYAFDPSGLSASSSAFALNVTDVRVPAVSLNYPVGYFNTSSSRVEFNFMVIDNFDTSLLCNLTLDGVYSNSTSAALNGSFSVLSGLVVVDGFHIWNVTCSDDLNNRNTSVSRTFYRDSVSPVVSLLSPSDAVVLVSNSTSFSFNFTDSYSSTASCSLFISGSNRSTNASVQNFSLAQFGPLVLAEGNVSWFVNCTDQSGNSGLSVVRSVRVPREVVNVSGVFVANVSAAVDGTQRSDLNISLLFNTSGSVAVRDYSFNPSDISAVGGNGFAAIGLPVFIDIIADSNISTGLGWVFVKIYYSDSDFNSTLNESTLRLYFLNESSQIWVLEPGSDVSITGNYVYGNVSHLSFFSLGGSAKVSSSSSSSSGGGGGGGGGSTSETPSVSLTVDGGSVSLGLNEVVTVYFEGDAYQFRVITLTGSLVGVRYIPTYQTFYMIEGDSGSVDFDSDGLDDATVSLSDVGGGKATLFFRAVEHEELPAFSVPFPVGGEDKEAEAVNADQGAQLESAGSGVSSGSGLSEDVSLGAGKKDSSETRLVSLESPKNPSFFSSLAGGALLSKVLLGVFVLGIVGVAVFIVLKSYEAEWAAKKRSVVKERREYVAKEVDKDLKQE
jgi:subtilisin family serine protease